MENTFVVSKNFTTSSQPAITYSGPAAAVFATGTEPDTWIVSMTAPGIYTFFVELLDEEGETYKDQVAVLVYDRATLDALLQAKWNKMKTAMTAGSIEGAVQEFTFGQREIFQEIFTITAYRLAQIALDMQPIEMIYQKNDTAEYRIRKDIIFKGTPETVTSYIYFQRERDGIWRIRDFW
jgi:hypothetical protein